MDKILELLRGSVRPGLAWLYSIAFIGLAVYSFIKWGTADMGLGLVTGLVGVCGTIAGIYFQSRNQAKPPEE